MGFYRGPNIVTDGLVLAVEGGSFRSYSGSGTTVTNLADETYNGTLVNGMQYDPEAGGCFVGDGTNDNITFGESDLTKGTATNAITYECWVKRTGDSTSTQPRLMSTDASDYNALYLVANDGRLTWRINIGLSTKINDYDPGLALNEWTHVVGTGEYNGTDTYSQYLYINGTTVDSNVNQSASGTWGDGTSRPFGVFANVEATVGNSGCLNGKITSIRVYSRALTSSEVLQNYNATRRRFGL